MKRLAVFLGSGVSIPSGLPSVGELYDRILYPGHYNIELPAELSSAYSNPSSQVKED